MRWWGLEAPEIIDWLYAAMLDVVGFIPGTLLATAWIIWLLGGVAGGRQR